MEVRLLGPLELLTTVDSPLAIGTPKQRLVLAMLATDAGRLVTIDQLVDELWPVDPPASAVANVRTYAANLRRLFDEVSSSRGLLLRETGGR
ncbi:winged helix-turn-helix domain-containing protein [Micromonospora sp. NPDC049497]|uniref:AfsR/SARP family transcriptional regulator n=1 Tax=Micromonospora sp. NPDC049497 TaxID=3364273 RepID=UPI00379F786A